MKILGIDYGTKRVGLALADELKIAIPFGCIQNSNNLINEIENIIKNEKITHIVIGNPKSLNGKEGPMSELIKDFALKLETFPDIEIFLHDERMSSKEASISLRSSKKKKKKRKDGTLDSIAATFILSSFLEMRKF